jgi:hypothetical protein
LKTRTKTIGIYRDVGVKIDLEREEIVEIIYRKNSMLAPDEVSGVVKDYADEHGYTVPNELYDGYLPLRSPFPPCPRTAEQWMARHGLSRETAEMIIETRDARKRKETQG